jgi:hypothetical protein
MAGEQIKRVSLRTVMCLRRMSALAHLCYGGVGGAPYAAVHVRDLDMVVMTRGEYPSGRSRGPRCKGMVP